MLYVHIVCSRVCVCHLCTLAQACNGRVCAWSSRVVFSNAEGDSNQSTLGLRLPTRNAILILLCVHMPLVPLLLYNVH